MKQLELVWNIAKSVKRSVVIVPFENKELFPGTDYISSNTYTLYILLLLLLLLLLLSIIIIITIIIIIIIIIIYYFVELCDLFTFLTDKEDSPSTLTLTLCSPEMTGPVVTKKFTSWCIQLIPHTIYYLLYIYVHIPLFCVCLCVIISCILMHILFSIIVLLSY